MADDYIKKVIKASAIENVCRSFFDEYVKYTVESRSKMGVQEKIIRSQTNGCCDWCSKQVGVYIYGEEPRDIYRRHRGCDCMVVHKSAKGYTNVHKKKLMDERDERIKKLNELETAYGSAQELPYKKLGETGGASSF